MSDAVSWYGSRPSASSSGLGFGGVCAAAGRAASPTNSSPKAATPTTSRAGERERIILLVLGSVCAASTAGLAVEVLHGGVHLRIVARGEDRRCADDRLVGRHTDAVEIEIVVADQRLRHLHLQ